MRSSKQVFLATTLFAAGILVGMYLISDRFPIPTLVPAA